MMSEIEEAYREGHTDAKCWPKDHPDKAWSESVAKARHDEAVRQRKIVREASEKLGSELNR